MLILRPYQADAIVRLRAAYAAGFRAPLLVSPTGSGKTQTAAAIISSAVARGRHVLFAAGRTELLDQTVDKLRGAGVTDVRLIQAERDVGAAAAPVTVGSIQTLTTDGWLERLPPAGMVIVDEAHHASCSSVARILARYPGAMLLGLTATPMRADRTSLSPPFDTLVVGPSVAELTALKHLVPCRVWAPPAGAALTSSKLALDPVAAYLEHGAGELATVFCSSVAHARATAEAFAAAGIPSAHVDGRMSAPRRAAVLADLAAGRIRVMPSVDVVTEGFDLPALSVAIMARKFGHVGRWIQAIGRVLRPSPGKTLARVIDLVGSAHEHGPPDAPREYTLDGDGIAPMVRTAFRQCPACFAMLVAAEACPHCGAEIPTRSRALPGSSGVGVTELAPRPPAAPRREFPRIMTSKFASACSSCGGAIARGEEIVWLTLARKAKHRHCPVQIGATA